MPNGYALKICNRQGQGLLADEVGVKRQVLPVQLIYFFHLIDTFRDVGHLLPDKEVIFKDHTHRRRLRVYYFLQFFSKSLVGHLDSHVVEVFVKVELQPALEDLVVVYLLADDLDASVGELELVGLDQVLRLVD